MLSANIQVNNYSANFINISEFVKDIVRDSMQQQAFLKMSLFSMVDLVYALHTGLMNYLVFKLMHPLCMGKVLSGVNLI
jgi:hypothetical protein